MTDGRPDSIALLEGQAVSRVPELVPIRYGRMVASPFSFYRGGALIMASDLSRTQNSGLQVQLCGDAHMSNFGIFATPERRLAFDVNDFDETHPGPFEWDVKRLAASLAVAGRDNGFGTKERRKIVLAAAAGYREAMADVCSPTQSRRLVHPPGHGRGDAAGRRRARLGAQSQDARQPWTRHVAVTASRPWPSSRAWWTDTPAS